MYNYKYYVAPWGNFDFKVCVFVFKKLYPTYTIKKLICNGHNASL